MESLVGTARGAKTLEFQSNVYGLGDSKDETEDMYELFHKSPQNFFIKDGQTSLPPFLVLAMADLYSVV